MAKLGQFEFDWSTFDPSMTDLSALDTSALDLGTLDLGTLDVGAIDPAAVDWSSYDPSAGDWTQAFSTDPASLPDYGLDPWTATMGVDSGNIGVDTAAVEPTAAEVASETGASVGDVANFQLEFPSVSLSDVVNLVKAGLPLYQAFQKAQTQPTARPGYQTVYDPRTGQYVQVPTGLTASATRTGLTASAPQRRTVTDPRTGKPVTVQWNAATGKWEPVTEWIAGIPNWAVIAAGVGAALLLLGKGKRSAH